MESRDKLIAIVEPILAAEGLELVDVEHRREGHGQVVRLLVDRAGGVDLGTLSRLSRELSVLFDVEEPIAGAYTLEVSSPGIHRPLRRPEHFARYIGKKVRVRCLTPIDGQRNFLGTLATVAAGGVTVQDDRGVETFVDFANIDKANYEHEFSAADFGKRAVPQGGSE